MAGTTDLQAQMRADPRLRAIVDRQRTGSLTAEQLRQYGYQVPDGYHYAFGGRSGYGTLMDDKRSLLETSAPYISIGAGAVAGAGAAGMVPGIGGVSGGGAAGGAAAEVAGIDKAVGGMGVGGWGAEAGAAGGAGNALKKMLTDPKTYASLAPMLMQLAGGSGGFGGNSGADNAFLEKAYADAQANNALKEARYRRTDPLHEMATQLAYNRMPTNVSNGVSLPRVPLPEGRT